MPERIRSTPFFIGRIKMHFSYCPDCGEKLTEVTIGDEGLVPFCESCQRPHFDLFTTSIITAVINEYNEIALLHQDYVSKTNHVLVAGIMKPRESAEETVIREVKEEIGQDVERLEFIQSYPYSGKDMLMLGFLSRVKKKDLRLSGEVDSAEWVALEKAPELLREGSISWDLVQQIIKKLS